MQTAQRFNGGRAGLLHKVIGVHHQGLDTHSFEVGSIDGADDALGAVRQEGGEVNRAVGEGQTGVYRHRDIVT